MNTNKINRKLDWIDGFYIKEMNKKELILWKESFLKILKNKNELYLKEENVENKNKTSLKGEGLDIMKFSNVYKPIYRVEFNHRLLK